MRRTTRQIDPVFVGGLRSGTTIACTLISMHSRYAELPELQFQSHSDGLTHLLAGKITMRRFLERMEGWYERKPPARPPGLDALVSRAEFEAILAPFASSFAEAPVESARALILTFAEARMRSTGKPSWVEGTPTTTTAASVLHQLVPEAKFVHMIRDGRDVVVSMRRWGWGSPDVREAVRWWGERVRLADEQCRTLPSDRFCTIELADLVRDDRERTYNRLLDFLDARDEPGMRMFFEERVTADAAHIGGWRDALSPAQADQLDSTYGAVIAGLRRDGVSLIPGAVAA